MVPNNTSYRSSVKILRELFEERGKQNDFKVYTLDKPRPNSLVIPSIFLAKQTTTTSTTFVRNRKLDSKENTDSKNEQENQRKSNTDITSFENRSDEKEVCNNSQESFSEVDSITDEEEKKWKEERRRKKNIPDIPSRLSLPSYFEDYVPNEQEKHEEHFTNVNNLCAKF